MKSVLEYQSRYEKNILDFEYLNKIDTSYKTQNIAIHTQFVSGVRD